jgi:hypothetical protein
MAVSVRGGNSKNRSGGVNKRRAPGRTDQKRRRNARAVQGRAASLRVRRELEGVFAEFMEATNTDEREFLLAVLADFLDMRGDEQDWLECIQTAFNQNLGDNNRLLRVTPDELGDVLQFLRWRADVEADGRGAVCHG